MSAPPSDGEDEAGELSARRPPTPCRGQVPGGGPQSAVDGEDEARELPARRHPTPPNVSPAAERLHDLGE